MNHNNDNNNIDNMIRTVSAVVAGVALIVGAGFTAASTPTMAAPPSTEVAGPVTSMGAAGDGTAGAELPVIDPGDGGVYEPTLNPADFVDVVDNPYFPLVPGSRWVYEGESDGEAERIEVEVLDERREIMGISASVVRDTVYIAGEMVEDTYDWYAQDVEGNVWYLGEDTHEYENGQAINDAGAWEYGVDGALPGIVMLAAPAVGNAYRQEFYAGEAEDMGEIIEVDATVAIGLGEYADVVVTEDWTPLDPDVVENKSYAPGIGMIYETKVAGGDGTVELVEFNPGA